MSDPASVGIFSPRRLACAAIVAAWVVITVMAFGWLRAYASVPGPSYDAPAAVSPAGRYSLHVFLHPKCPCSRATLAELARLTARAGDRMTTRVLFILPKDAGPDWQQGSLYDAARAIPGVEVAPDPAGELADRYGAATSGHAVLYDRDGRLAFAGGITAARGHEGDNDGRSAILEMIEGHASSVDKTPVFGCELFDGDRAPTAPGLPAGKAP